MAGTGPPPAKNRRRTNEPVRGEWKATPGSGWQHGPVPGHPGALRPATVEVWTVWMQSWFAAHWTPDDLPGLAIVIQTYDQCQAYFDEPFTERETRKGDTIYVLKPNPTPELRQLMDNYGITPKGQQDRRWVRPDVSPPADKTTAKAAVQVPTAAPYRGLSVVAGGKA